MRSAVFVCGFLALQLAACSVYGPESGPDINPDAGALSEDPGEDIEEGGETSAMSIAGVGLSATEERWVKFVAESALPAMTSYFGSRARALDAAALVSWWSLKEGVMSLGNPLAYSNCHFSSGDRHIGAYEVCPGSIWQVGLSAVQVHNSTTERYEQIAGGCFPGASIVDVLRTAAAQAGVDPNIVGSSSGNLRKSWLARSTCVGYVAQEPIVYGECIAQSKSWCYGSGWPATRRFAPNKSTALRVIADLRGQIDGLSNPPSAPAPGCGRLVPGEKLTPGQSRKSCSGVYTLAHQGDGNLVLYKSGSPVWHTATYGQGSRELTMQGDGNLVLYASSGAALWHTFTGGYKNAYLAIQDDGNLVVYWGNRPLWYIGAR